MNSASDLRCDLSDLVYLNEDRNSIFDFGWFFRLIIDFEAEKSEMKLENPIWS